MMNKQTTEQGGRKSKNPKKSKHEKVKQTITMETSGRRLSQGGRLREMELEELWGLNTYLYGPKDDLKHRLLWREVYSPEEEAQLQTLIVEAQSRGLRFVYALSPGQDIVFSSSCDMTLLKRKLKQVSDLGCQAYAILFDDIDHSMCQADSEAFSSFAHAQVTVTNEIYRFLGEPPVFLFCPTEYCGSLCSPSVAESPYLQTVGEDLLPNITVIWTGKKKKRCLESVLQRPPLIWDNLHANDYDTRRLFLGPFKGRDPHIRSHLRGLLLNPNCEFEANYIPLHTLGSWYRAEKDDAQGNKMPFCLIGEEYNYCPERALTAALHDWMEELNQPLQAGKTVQTKELGGSLDHRYFYILHPLILVADKEGREGEKKRSQQQGQPLAGSKSAAPFGGGRAQREQRTQGRGLCNGKGLLSEAQVRLLVGLHYLPHEHGPSAQKLLQDLTWLKSNCHLVGANSKKPQPQKVDEWRGRASRFLSLCEDIAQLHCSVVGGANRAVLYDLYPYVWDLRNTALVAKAFICWLGCGKTTGADQLGVDSEPWVFKGGVSGEVQMLLPVGSSSELFTHPPPLFPTSRLYNIRPYHIIHLICFNNNLSLIIYFLFLTTYRCLGPCLALSPEYSFILEDELGICGCVLGILDVRSFAKRCQGSWIPAMRDKYPPKGNGTHSNTLELVQLMEEDQGEYPDSLLYHFPSQLRLDALPELVDISVSRTLLTALLTALKANGSQGVFCEVQPTDHQRLEFLTKLGFLEILRGEARSREGVVLGRLL
uniref:protein O-GlcNAcase n=1 Tax=Cyprinodon variegatus TaxID=28743 RepID=A0A3Q2GMF2_CYPVA